MRKIIVACAAAAIVACGEHTTTKAPAPATRTATKAVAEATAPTSAVGVVTPVPSPAGAGAAEPFLFATRDAVLLSWLEPVAGSGRAALRFAQYRGGEWSAPRTIVESHDLVVNWADFPSVAVDANGALFAQWLEKSGKAGSDVRMAVSKDGGGSWGKALLLNRDGKPLEHGFATLAPLPHGGIGVTWLDGRNMVAGDGDEEGTGDMTLRYATVDAAGTVADDTELDNRTCECCTTGMAMTASGPVIVYRDRSPEEIRDIASVRRVGDGWSQPKRVRADNWKINGCPVNGPQADAIGNNVVVAWFTAAGDQPRVYAAFSSDGGATFGDAIAVDEGKPLGRIDTVMLDDGAAVVSWLEQTPAGAEIRARRISRTGQAAASVKIAEGNPARSAGFTRIARSGREVWFAWTEQAGKAKSVLVARAAF